MQKLNFINSMGTVEFFLGRGGVWNVTQMDGFLIPTRDYNISKYSGRAGQKTISQTDGARTITIGGTIKTDDFEAEFSRVSRIFYQGGRLICYFENKQRRIDCYVNNFECQTGRRIKEFTLQFTADIPYFNDIEDTRVDIFKRQGNLSGTWQLPLLFSTRINKNDVTVTGEINSEPIIYIVDIGSSGAGAGATTGVVIKNNTTNKFVNLKYQTHTNEIITIDIYNRKILSNIYGNIINYLDNYSFLEDFYLKVGTNLIEVVNNNADREIGVYLLYNNNYLECAR